MCLLDEVLRWDSDGALCTSTSHRDPSNPLRRAGRLSAAHAIEYGGQAAALHGALCENIDNPRLLLGAARDLSLSSKYLDALPSPLMVEVRLLMRAGGSAIYGFELTADGVRYARGRVTLMRHPDGKS
jgi:predicted hotdog family 3-hydroxylacyl-ACP dehydratase